MNAVLIGMVVYVLAQFAIGAWVSRRMTTEADYILAGRRLGTAPGGVLGVCHLLRRRSDRRLGRLRLREGPGGRAGRPVRLRSRHHHRRPVLCPLAVVARADHLRRPVPPALFAGRRAPGGDHPAAGLGHLGGRAGACVRPGAERQLGPRPRHGHHAGGGAGGGILGRWRTARRRRHRHHPGHRRGGGSRHPGGGGRLGHGRARPGGGADRAGPPHADRPRGGSARRRSSIWPYPCAERSSPWS